MSKEKEKDAFYFSHDANSRNDDKLLAVRMKHGAAGYGVFFMILERMRESADYMSTADYNIISFDLRVDAGIVKSIVEEFGLFEITEDGKKFYSKSFLERMKKWDESREQKRIAGKKSALKRFENQQETTGVQRAFNERSTSVELRKEKKGKENKRKIIEDDDKSSSIATSSTKNNFSEKIEIVEKVAPPEIFNVEPLHLIENLPDIVMKDEMNFQRLFFQLGIRDKEGLYNWLLAFNKFLKFSNTHRKTEKDYRHHFSNWIRKQNYLSENPINYSPVKAPDHEPKLNSSGKRPASAVGQSAGAITLIHDLAEDLNLTAE